MPLNYDELVKGYKEALSGASKSSPILSPEQVQKAFGEGGSFASTLGYTNPRQLLGMTPEVFDNYLTQRNNTLLTNQKMAESAVELKDKIYGISEGRRAEQQMAQDVFRNSSEQLRHEETLDQRREEHEDTMDYNWERFNQEDRKFAFEKDEALFNRGIKREEIGIRRASLAAQLEDAKRDERYRWAELGYRDKWNKAQNDMQLMNISADRAERQARIDLALIEEAGRNDRNNQDIALRKQEANIRLQAAQAEKEVARQQSNQIRLVTLTEKLGVRKSAAETAMRNGKGAEKNIGRADYAKYTLQQAALESDIGATYNANSFKDVLGGYSQLMKGKDGHWYGIERDKSGKIIKASKSPIVYHPAPDLK